jgi:hypothetical protein
MQDIFKKASVRIFYLSDIEYLTEVSVVGNKRRV